MIVKSRAQFDDSLPRDGVWIPLDRPRSPFYTDGHFRAEGSWLPMMIPWVDY